MTVKHGGNLLSVAKEYQSEPAQWLDLSTGVSPFAYPLGTPPVSCWNALPQEGDGLEQLAMSYYASAVEPLAVAGSQAAIMALPETLTKVLGRCGTIVFPEVGYKEHQHAWDSFQLNGQKWKLEFFTDFPSQQQLDSADVVLIINPNNPTGRYYSPQQLMNLQSKLEEKGGYLIVDEAFADATPEYSLLQHDNHSDSLIVLRSVGKFFGLAGARVGFLFANDSILGGVRESLGPWTVSGPARWATKQALADSDWQQQNKIRLSKHSQRLKTLLDKYFSQQCRGTELFTTVFIQNAEQVHQQLCSQMIYTRLCDEKNAVRFGLPACEAEWMRLEIALMMVCSEQPQEVRLQEVN
ncbi:threonine-phosphate decarboxylase CobD [Vibrio sp. SCSIO 43137]|uniref:threonine-phosphate decarboxylase CobD n=1 Tax=Vibrio sp. SCSIO 43137 TaxID=3021011 RepID=UPI0023082899|nr:threonine-phosphate decarboxylase CobD [Vibrio sp. SCSIO 43137]WCE31467.1 threonine-phosphate decarboxylase CobD [Vibrio sp. SCSIO 43137]